MNQQVNPHQETPLEKEIREFKEYGKRVLTAYLSWVFNLNPKKARMRGRLIILVMILIGFFVSLHPHPLGEWGDHLKDVYDAIILGEPVGILNSIIGFINLGLQVFINPHTLWYFPAFFLPILISYYAAAFYLDDVFELNSIGISSKFIRQVALTGSNDAIRITNGEISPKHLKSPIYKIGGPGKVIVDLDSVALFEKADGRPNVIGPTGKLPDGKAELEGFERIRNIIDLRDQFIDLGDPVNELRETKGELSAIKSRSLDGIIVTATDVRMMFSIDRGDKESTNDLPYPFKEEAVKRHIYRSVSKVQSTMRDTSSVPKSMPKSISKLNFQGAILGLIGQELGKFMSQRNLTAYLASINLPEVLRAKQQEDSVVEEARPVLEPTESAEQVRRPLPIKPAFVPREDVTNLFSQFAEEFSTDASNKGVKLHWIGVGTWKVPNEMVAEKHLEAWTMSQENARMDNEKAMNAARTEARTQKIISLIGDVPLGVFNETIINMDNKEQAINALCKEYLKQINDNYQQLLTKKRRIPPTLVATLSLMNRMFWVYVPPGPIPPRTPEENRLFREALNKIRSGDVIERLAELELGFSPNASRVEILGKIITDWDLDIAGNWRSDAVG